MSQWVQQQLDFKMNHPAGFANIDIWLPIIGSINKGILLFFIAIFVGILLLTIVSVLNPTKHPVRNPNVIQGPQGENGKQTSKKALQISRILDSPQITRSFSVPSDGLSTSATWRNSWTRLGAMASTSGKAPSFEFSLQLCFQVVSKNKLSFEIQL